MENQEVSESKPLSYEASKAVLKSLSLETREDINRQIPKLRTMNSRLPYILEDVVIADDTFQTNGRQWTITPALVRNSDNPLEEVVDPEKSEVVIRQYNSHKSEQYRVDKSQKEVYKQLFDEYIRNGTIVRGELFLRGIPEFMKEKRENERELKIKVANLKLDKQAAADCDQFIRFIDLDVLENVKFIALENSLALLDKPEIKTCKNLIVYFIVGRPTNFSIDQFLRLRNQHLKLDDDSFTLHELQLYVQDWITTGRKIGTRFTWGPCQSEDVLPMKHLKTHFGADEAGSHLENYFSDKTIHGTSLTLKMGEDRELVMYCGKDNERTLYSFEMEVVAITTDIVPTPDV
ncbi:hypothetical protein CRE_17468 [Caenorhabditis remanei]|uniref:F-box associated domain-containing protein n=1 Tax=Caenorhabditis remanei TaxID=31234 RepID=E3N274_CAERE|nr:hypothetical protein CRE_17468 [Caenorhabditis remanei]